MDGRGGDTEIESSSVLPEPVGEDTERTIIDVLDEEYQSCGEPNSVSTFLSAGKPLQHARLAEELCQLY